MSGPALPPLGPLLAVVRSLESAGVRCGLGGSGLLAALGLAHRVGDWDLTTDQALKELLPIFAGRERDIHGSSGQHADQKIVLHQGRVELIVRFAIHSGEAVVHIPTVVTSRWRDVPVGSPEAWAAAYWLLGQTGKAETLLRHLGRHGASRATIARLLGEPLPHDLRTRLEALPAGSDTGSVRR